MAHPMLHPEELRYKIADFGCAYICQGFASYPETFVGTKGPFMAPEMMEVMEQCPGQSKKHYGSAIDVWALGMIWLEIR